MSLAAGDLSRLIDIERRVGRDELNQPIDTWEFVMSRWAQPKGQTGMGSIRTAGESGGVTRDINAYSWRIRYCPTGIDSGMRVNFKGMLFDIQQVRHDLDRREWTDLVCEAGGNDG